MAAAVRGGDTVPMIKGRRREQRRGRGRRQDQRGVLLMGGGWDRRGNVLYSTNVILRVSTSIDLSSHYQYIIK